MSARSKSSPAWNSLPGYRQRSATKRSISARPEPCGDRAARSPLVKHEKRAGRDQREADALVPGDRLLEIEHRETGEHQERDHLLHGLELGGVIDSVAVTIGRHRQAIFDKGQPPADQDD